MDRYTVFSTFHSAEDRNNITHLCCAYIFSPPYQALGINGAAHVRVPVPDRRLRGASLRCITRPSLIAHARGSLHGGQGESKLFSTLFILYSLFLILDSLFFTMDRSGSPLPQHIFRQKRLTRRTRFTACGGACPLGTRAPRHLLRQWYRPPAPALAPQ